jgi:hypothetical protein
MGTIIASAPPRPALYPRGSHSTTVWASTRASITWPACGGRAGEPQPPFPGRPRLRKQSLLSLSPSHYSYDRTIDGTSYLSGSSRSCYGRFSAPSAGTATVQGATLKLLFSNGNQPGRDRPFGRTSPITPASIHAACSPEGCPQRSPFGVDRGAWRTTNSPKVRQSFRGADFILTPNARAEGL